MADENDLDRMLDEMLNGKPSEAIRGRRGTV